MWIRLILKNQLAIMRSLAILRSDYTDLKYNIEETEKKLRIKQNRNE